MTLAAQPYEGPECPRCGFTLTQDLLRTGAIDCPNCRKSFEATAFAAPQRTLHVAAFAATGPTEGGACANHALNAAVSSCQRCGVFMCALCEMSVGAGTFCPTCFQKLRDEQSAAAGPGRSRDYVSSARVALVAGFFFTFMGMGWGLGIVAAYYTSKALKQRRERGGPVGGIRFMAVLAGLEIVGGFAYFIFLVYVIAKGQ